MQLNEARNIARECKEEEDLINRLGLLDNIRPEVDLTPESRLRKFLEVKREVDRNDGLTVGRLDYLYQLMSNYIGDLNNAHHNISVHRTNLLRRDPADLMIQTLQIERMWIANCITRRRQVANEIDRRIIELTGEEIIEEDDNNEAEDND